MFSVRLEPKSCKFCWSHIYITTKWKNATASSNRLYGYSEVATVTSKLNLCLSGVKTLQLWNYFDYLHWGNWSVKPSHALSYPLVKYYYPKSGKHIIKDLEFSRQWRYRLWSYGLWLFPYISPLTLIQTKDLKNHISCRLHVTDYCCTVQSKCTNRKIKNW